MHSSRNRFSRSGSPSSGRRRTFNSTPRHKRRGSSPHAARGGGGRRGSKVGTFNPAQFINTNPVAAKEDVYTPKHTFDTFGLTKELVENIHELGAVVPTPIQDQIIPHMLEGRDVVGMAETGTGKTAAFLIPLIEKTVNDLTRQTLILTPTRELAIQIESEMRKLSKGARLFSTLCVGGTAVYPQIKKIKMRNHFVIGTPGRILDLINRGVFKTDEVTTVILDEADRMLDMGFIGDITKILDATPKERETHFFSATMAPSVENLIKKFSKDPVVVSVKKRDVTSSIEQDVVPYVGRHKFETLVSLFQDDSFKRVIVFGSMKHAVEKLSQELIAHGIKAESIHGNKTHGARQRALGAFKNGQARVLVATDVAARGIHVDDVSHVINYDLPQTFDDYVHRIGRTGRGTKRGKALTFVPQ